MADFRVTDKRASARMGVAPGIVVGQSVADAKRLAGAQVTSALQAGRQGVIPTDPVAAQEMAASRLRRQGAAIGGGGGGSLNFAIQRPQDPMFYWRANNLPYDFTKPDHLILLRQMCRHIYRAHSVMASAIDIFSRWPVVEMELECKDPAIKQFYEDLLFDQLDYYEYLADMLREYWTVGEALPLGSFNENLGVWEDDELLNPDDVFVEKSPFIKDPTFSIRLPKSLREILSSQTPRPQYEALIRSYPELMQYTHESARMPVSNVLLRHVKFKTDPFATRGLPIMYRALRPLMQEEMLNAAQDAIADRLYTPLILARLGASATDLGTQEPWIPTDSQIVNFERSLDVALAADFRVLTTHFAVQMDSVFGRETMPNFDADFERLTEKQLQAFGLSKTMISGAGGGETYAADALNRDLVSQLLATVQRDIQKFVKNRMLVVAEAQEHYDYEERGGKKYPIMEEVLEIDEETGEQRVVEQPKLLIPKLKLRSMNMKDEENERGFLEALRAGGVPISQKRRLVNIDLDLDEEIEKIADEQVDQAVAAQLVRKRTYERLKAERLPIPEDLRIDFDPRPVNAGDVNSPAQPATREPTIGLDGQDTVALAPTPEQQMIPPGDPLGVPAGAGGTIMQPGQGGGGQGATVIPLPTNRLMRSRPEESDEMRANMPRPAALKDLNTGETIVDGQGNPVLAKPGGIVQGPSHVGMRRYARVSKDTPVGEVDHPEPSRSEG